MRTTTRSEDREPQRFVGEHQQVARRVALWIELVQLDGGENPDEHQRRDPVERDEGRRIGGCPRRWLYGCGHAIFSPENGAICRFGLS